MTTPPPHKPDLRLVEPVGLLRGPVAAEAVRAGIAAPLAGGPAAFCLAGLIAADGGRALVPVRDVPADWTAALTRVTAPVPGWAGLPAGRPLVMGVLNVTPDSFSDGGRHFDPSAAIAAGREMVAAGADILDIGGESTRPGAAEVSAAEEQGRVLPVIRGLAGLCALSVDTRHAVTMAAALDAGADIVNDVSGLAHDPAAIPLLARRGCPVILMHMRGTPATMLSLSDYQDAAVEVTRELEQRIAAAVAGGIAREKIAVDPGIGFAKNTSQSREVLLRLSILANLGCRIVLGVSRKSMIGQLSGEMAPANRLGGSLAAGLVGVAGGAAILRVHDVGATAQALRVWHGIVSCGNT